MAREVSNLCNGKEAHTLLLRLIAFNILSSGPSQVIDYGKGGFKPLQWQGGSQSPPKLRLLTYNYILSSDLS